MVKRTSTFFRVVAGILCLVLAVRLGIDANRDGISGATAILFAVSGVLLIVLE